MLKRSIVCKQCRKRKLSVTRGMSRVGGPNETLSRMRLVETNLVFPILKIVEYHVPDFSRQKYSQNARMRLVETNLVFPILKIVN